MILADYLAAARRAVFFTGAGMSTESGIPDFRSPGGIWSRMQPIMYQDFLRSAEMRREAWRRRFAMEPMWAEARPNRGHLIVARLVQSGQAIGVITQNIDNLHQQSGIPADKVVELHGNTRYAKCLECGLRHELEPIREAFMKDAHLPACGICGGIVKTATVSFGEAMPEDAMAQAEAMTRAADLFVVLGSSLVVYPAAGFPAMAKRLGARLVIVNREPTDLDAVADLVIHEEIGQTLASAVGAN